MYPLANLMNFTVNKWLNISPAFVYTKRIMLPNVVESFLEPITLFSADFLCKVFCHIDLVVGIGIIRSSGRIPSLVFSHKSHSYLVARVDNSNMSSNSIPLNVFCNSISRSFMAKLTNFDSSNAIKHLFLACLNCARYLSTISPWSCLNCERSAIETSGSI